MKFSDIVPDPWVLTTCGEIADVVGGGTPATSNPENFGGSISWITPSDLSKHTGMLIYQGARFLSQKGLEGSGARLLPKGTVLFSSRAPIGYVAIASQPLTTNQGFKSFVPATGISSEYLYYWLIYAKPLAEGLASGTTFLEISGAKSALIPFPLAPSAEQSRIVAKLEELFSDLDAGVAELKAAQKKLAQYRQSLLKAAVEGMLTAEWRAKNKPKETGAQLLERILKERRTRWEAKQLARFKGQGKIPPKGWQDKYPELVQPDTTNLAELPEGWVWASLDCMIEDGPQNGLYLPSEKYGRGHAILRIDDFQIGWVRTRADLNLVDADVDKADTYSLRSGDVVINRVNSMTHLGKSLVVPDTLDSVLFESNMMKMRLSPLAYTEYVGLYLGSELGRKRLICNAKWAVNQASINQQDVKRTPIPFPPFEEQIIINEIVATQLSSIEAQEKAIAYGIMQAAAQRKNILKSAFSGQLVPQDPADELASLLLERIRAERQKGESSTKKRSSRKKVNEI